MGYFIDKNYVWEQWIFPFSEMICILGILLSVEIVEDGLWNLSIIAFIIMKILWRASNKQVNNYLVFEEEGIRILKYGKTWDSYLEWSRIQYVYLWGISNHPKSYYILSEKPLSRKRRNRIVNWQLRDIKDGLVIPAGDDWNPVSKSVEKMILTKLSHIAIEERKPWYRYYNEKNNK